MYVRRLLWQQILSYLQQADEVHPMFFYIFVKFPEYHLNIFFIRITTSIREQYQTDRKTLSGGLNA